jgi:hypothetical protein
VRAKNLKRTVSMTFPIVRIRGRPPSCHLLSGSLVLASIERKGPCFRDPLMENCANEGPSLHSTSSGFRRSKLSYSRGARQKTDSHSARGLPRLRLLFASSSYFRSARPPTLPFSRDLLFSAVLRRPRGFFACGARILLVRPSADSNFSRLRPPPTPRSAR